MMAKTALPATSQNRVVIEVHPADVADVTDKTIAVLKANNQVFSQGGRVVQVATVPMEVGEGSTTHTYLAATTIHTLRDTVSRHVLYRHPSIVTKDKSGRSKTVRGRLCSLLLL